MTAPAPLMPAGYALPAPPRTGSWRIDPGVSYLELRVRELHRTSVLEAAIVDGEAHLTATASTSGIWLQLGAAVARGSSRATDWMRVAGLDSIAQPPRFHSGILLAAPHGWRMCGQLRAERLDAMLIADAQVHSVRTQTDGHDVMVMTARGAITRTGTRGLNAVLLRRRVPGLFSRTGRSL